MSKNRRGHFALSLCLALLISGCGGGGGGGGGGGIPLLPGAATPPSASNPPQTETPVEPPADPSTRPMATTRYSYMLGDADVQSFDAFLVEANSDKFKDWKPRELQASAIPIGGQMKFRALYQRTEDGKYVHRAVSDKEAMKLTTLNALGAEGYSLSTLAIAFFGPSGYQAIFSKNTNASVKYEYVDAGVLPSSSEDRPAFVALLNKLGAEGYCQLQAGSDSTGGTDAFHAFLVRELPSKARCSFSFGPTPKTIDERVSLGNKVGAEGMLRLGDLNGESLYIKDATQQAIFKHELIKLDMTDWFERSDYLKKLVALYNEQGARGAIQTESLFSSEEQRSYLIFTTAYDCNEFFAASNGRR